MSLARNHRENGEEEVARLPPLPGRFRIWAVLAAASAALVLLQVFLGQPSPSAAADGPETRASTGAGSLEVVPASTTVERGDLVTVAIRLSEAVDYYGLDCTLGFNPGVVRATRLTPVWDAFSAAHHQIAENAIDNAAGEVRYAVTNLNPAEAFSGSGRVILVTFRAVAPGTSPLDILDALGATRDGEPLAPTTVDGEIIVGGPPDPGPEAGSLEVVPSSATVTEGDLVTVAVRLSGAADYYGLDFTLGFDPGVVSAARLTPVWDVFSASHHDIVEKDLDNAAGVVRYAVTNLNPAQPFTGTGRVALVTFRGLAPGTSPAELLHALGGTRDGEPLVPTTADGAILVNGLPTADAGGPYSGRPGQSVTLDGSGSYDPEGALVNYTWHVNGSRVYSGADATHDLSLDGYAAGNHSVMLNVTDAEGATDSDTATLSVSPPPTPTPGNRRPRAVDDSVVTDEDTPVAIPVLANDVEPDGVLDPESLTIAAGPAHGSLTVGGSGVVTYTPDPDFNGNDGFSYTVQDDEGDRSNEATVSVTVRDVNDPPVAVDDEAAGQQETAVEINVVENDWDIDGTVDPASVSIVSPPAHGSVSASSGTATYTPTVGYVGDDAFTYTVEDDDGALSNAASVIVHIPASGPDTRFLYLPLVSRFSSPHSRAIYLPLVHR